MPSIPTRKTTNIASFGRIESSRDYTRSLSRAIRCRTQIVDPEERYNEDEPKPVDEEFR